MCTHKMEQCEVMRETMSMCTHKMKQWEGDISYYGFEISDIVHWFAAVHWDHHSIVGGH